MKKLTFLLFCLLLISHFNNAQTFTDTRDGQKYKIVKIGNQIWMAQNLNYNTGNSTCDKCETYGSLYNWETAKKACPSYWHLPTDDEWNILVDYLGGPDVAGNKLKTTSEWANTGMTNSSGFSALPAGSYQPGTRRTLGGGILIGPGLYGIWWSATERNKKKAWGRYMGFDTPGILRVKDKKNQGYSVRCIKDN